jgi:hypothetical protein
VYLVVCWGVLLVLMRVVLWERLQVVRWVDNLVVSKVWRSVVWSE